MTEDPIDPLHPVDPVDAAAAAERLVTFLETGTPPPGLLADDVFCDFTMPLWRLQARGIEAVIALRKAGHPSRGRVGRRRFDTTPTGFVLEFEERWEQDSQRWYSREMARADLTDGAISDLSVYCTGDWDEALQARHGREVPLLRP
jgi:hypothetical protein